MDESKKPPTTKRFNAYEIHHVGSHWTLYGHVVKDGLEPIAEVKTEEDARILLYKLTGIIATAGNPGPYMARRK